MRSGAEDACVRLFRDLRWLAVTSRARAAALVGVVSVLQDALLVPPKAGARTRKMLVQMEPQLVPALGGPIRSPTGREPSCVSPGRSPGRGLLALS